MAGGTFSVPPTAFVAFALFMKNKNRNGAMFNGY